MFDDQPNYLGGLTTQLQDSMQGIEYGRSDINPNGQYVPNNSANGTAYREVPKKATAKFIPNEQDIARQQQTAQRANGGDLFAVVQTHIDQLSNESKPVDFFDLKMPSKLIETTPNPQDWIESLKALEGYLQDNASLDLQLKDPRVSVARLALEFIQPGTIKMDNPSQIERAQQLRSHLEARAKDMPAAQPPIQQPPKFSEIVMKCSAWGRDNLRHPRTKVGMYSVPQFLVNGKQSHLFTEQSLDALLNALDAQIKAGEDLVIPEESLKLIIPIVGFTVGSMPANVDQLNSMVNQMFNYGKSKRLRPTRPVQQAPSRLVQIQASNQAANEPQMVSASAKNAELQPKNLPTIIQQSLEWAQGNANQVMTKMGAFVFPASFLKSPDAQMFQEPILLNMLGQTLQELQLGKLSGSVHWDVLETMIPIIVFSVGKFPPSTDLNISIPFLIKAGQILMANSVKMQNVNANMVNANANMVNANMVNANANMVNANLVNANANMVNANQTTDEPFLDTTAGKVAVGLTAAGLIGYFLKSR